MSRLILYAQNGSSLGEMRINLDRTWAINNTGQSTAVLSAENAAKGWANFGRMVSVEHAKLAPWAGVIDTPWQATLPAQMTVYNAGYLLHLRAPAASQTISGTTAGIVSKLIEQANQAEDLRLRVGEMDFDDSSRAEKFDRRDYWTLILELVIKAGYELQMRPGRDGLNRLVVYVDVQRRVGADTGYLLHDGEAANIEVSDAQVDGELWNCVTGIGSQQIPMVGNTQRDEKSIAAYRLRSETKQWQGADAKTVLNSYALVEIARAQPKLTLKVNGLDVGDTFKQLRLGNTFIVHASQIYLPGGVKGWRGSARITAMAYNEATNKVGLNLEAYL